MITAEKIWNKTQSIFSIIPSKNKNFVKPVFHYQSELHVSPGYLPTPEKRRSPLNQVKARLEKSPDYPEQRVGKDAELSETTIFTCYNLIARGGADVFPFADKI